MKKLITIKGLVEWLKVWALRSNPSTAKKKYILYTHTHMCVYIHTYVYMKYEDSILKPTKYCLKMEGKCERAQGCDPPSSQYMQQGGRPYRPDIRPASG
jgi:hypothetical protein